MTERRVFTGGFTRVPVLALALAFALVLSVHAIAASAKQPTTRETLFNYETLLLKISLTLPAGVGPGSESLLTLFSEAVSFHNPLTLELEEGRFSRNTLRTVFEAGKARPAIDIPDPSQLPPGMTYADPSGYDGALIVAGTPASGSAGTYFVTVRATWLDRFNPGTPGTTDQIYTLNVSAPLVATPEAPRLPDFVVNQVFFEGPPFDDYVRATGTPAPVITAVGLPDGISVDGNGVVSGAAAAGTAGIYNVTFTATNASGSDTYEVDYSVGELPPFFENAEFLAPPISGAATVGLQFSERFETESFDPTAHDDDIVWSDGFFVLWPDRSYKGNGISKTPAPVELASLGISFVDNGDGSATLSGTPNATASGLSGTIKISTWNQNLGYDTLDYELIVAACDPDVDPGCMTTPVELLHFEIR